MKVFVDTNVLIDFICRREPFFASAKSVFAFGYLGKIDIIISSLSIVNALYIGRKYDSSMLRANLFGLSKIVNYVDLPATLVLQTLHSKWGDYEDALQNASALMAEAYCIVTRNKKDFIASSLPLYTPEEFIELFDF